MKSSSLMSGRQLYSSNKKVHGFAEERLSIVHTASGKAELLFSQTSYATSFGSTLYYLRLTIPKQWNLKSETVSFMQLAFRNNPPFYITRELTSFILTHSGMGHALWHLVHELVSTAWPRLPLWYIIQCLC